MPVSTTNKIQLGKKLRMAREDAKLSQRQAAKNVDISNAALSDIETGTNFPSEMMLLKLLECYQTQPELRGKIIKVYSEAKGVPPPDLSVFIKENADVQSLLYTLMKKELSPDGLQALRQTLEKMEDRHNEPDDQH